MTTAPGSGPPRDRRPSNPSAYCAPAAPTRSRSCSAMSSGATRTTRRCRGTVLRPGRRTSRRSFRRCPPSRRRHGCAGRRRPWWWPSPRWPGSAGRCCSPAAPPTAAPPPRPPPPPPPRRRARPPPPRTVSCAKATRAPRWPHSRNACCASPTSTATARPTAATTPPSAKRSPASSSGTASAATKQASTGTTPVRRWRAARAGRGWGHGVGGRRPGDCGAPTPP